MVHQLGNEVFPDCNLNGDFKTRKDLQNCHLICLPKGRTHISNFRQAASLFSAHLHQYDKPNVMPTYLCPFLRAKSILLANFMYLKIYHLYRKHRAINSQSSLEFHIKKALGFAGCLRHCRSSHKFLLLLFWMENYKKAARPFSAIKANQNKHYFNLLLYFWLTFTPPFYWTFSCIALSVLLFSYIWFSSSYLKFLYFLYNYHVLPWLFLLCHCLWWQNHYATSLHFHSP